MCFFGFCFCINRRTDLVIAFVSVQHFKSLWFCCCLNLVPTLYKITKYTEKAEFVTLVHTHRVNKSLFFVLFCFLMYGFAKVDYEVTFCILFV